MLTLILRSNFRRSYYNVLASPPFSGKSFCFLEHLKRRTPPGAASGRRSIFNGETLAGWPSESNTQNLSTYSGRIFFRIGTSSGGYQFSIGDKLISLIPIHYFLALTVVHVMQKRLVGKRVWVRPLCEIVHRFLNCVVQIFPCCPRSVKTLSRSTINLLTYSFLLFKER